MFADDDEPKRVTRGAPGAGYRIQPPPVEARAAWVPAGKSVRVGQWTIPGGLFYFGQPGSRIPQGLLAALVNPHAEVDPTFSRNNHYNSYSTLFSPYAAKPGYAGFNKGVRAQFLQWMADGRRSRSCDERFWRVFLYGIEHRILVEAYSKDPAVAAAVRADYEPILKELTRLAGRLGGDFWHAVTPLIDLIQIFALREPAYSRPIPGILAQRPMSRFLRLGLAQCATDGEPVPDHFALTWLKAEGAPLRTPAKRCAEKFAVLFAHRYYAYYGDGAHLKPSREQFVFSYEPLNGWLTQNGAKRFNYREVACAEHSSQVLDKLAELADAAAQELDPYSRFVAQAAESDEGVTGGTLLLPAVLWPEHIKKAVSALNKRVQQEPVVLRWDSLLAIFDPSAPPGRASAVAIARGLEATGIGFEPDVLVDAKTPAAEDLVMLFAAGPEATKQVRKGGFHKGAENILQVLAFLALIDGTLRPQELRLLHELIEKWGRGNRADGARLKARLSLFEQAPPTLAGLKGKFAGHNSETLQTLAQRAVQLVRVDGEASPEEIAALEKVYKLLGVDPATLYSDLHGAATGVSFRPKSGGPSTMALDHSRVARLQDETMKVSALLSGIFSDDVTVPPAAVVTTPPEQQSSACTTKPRAEPATTGNTVKRRNSVKSFSLPGLDAAHSDFVARLIKKSEWTRGDLEQLAATLELMLDGALERVNEACFEAHDLPLTEGDDPVSLNAEVPGLVPRRRNAKQLAQT